MNSYSQPEARKISSFYIACGIIISLAAIAEFIIWIIDATIVHTPNLLMMGIGFLVLSVGCLWYCLFRNKAYHCANWGLWISVIASIALMFVGLAIH